MNDLNIINATLVYPEGLKKAHVGIRGKHIFEIAENCSGLNSAPDVIDAQGLLMFPGLIDSHVHIRGGAFSYREDFTTGSMAAAAGGITTVLEMPVCAKPVNTAVRFKERSKEVLRDGFLSFGLYGAAGADNVNEIANMAKAGVIGFKTFQMPPVPGREAEFIGMCAQTYEDLVLIMSRIAPTGLSLTIHCESQKIIGEKLKAIHAKGLNGLKAFADSRPPEAELESVELVIRAAAETGCRAIIAHTSTPETIELVQKARKKGVAVYVESCAQYLCFDVSQMEHHGVFARMKPPFRDRERVERMVLDYAEGRVDITGSDHAPYTLEEKTRNGKDDIWNTFDGLAGLEMSLPLLFSLVETGRLSYERIAAAFSQNTANLFGLKQKGRIDPGRDADLVLVKKETRKIPFDNSRLFSKSRDIARIYQDLAVSHKVDTVISRGTRVLSGGMITARPGCADILVPARNERGRV